MRAISLTDAAPSTLRRAIDVHPIVAVPAEYSLSARYPELGLIQMRADFRVAVVAYAPVGRSLLTDHPIQMERISNLSFRSKNPRFMGPKLSENLRITNGFRALAKNLGTSAVGFANAWLFTQADHVIPILGTRSVDHLRECLSLVASTLNQADIKSIDTALPVGWAHRDRHSKSHLFSRFS